MLNIKRLSAPERQTLRLIAEHEAMNLVDPMILADLVRAGCVCFRQGDLAPYPALTPLGRSVAIEALPSEKLAGDAA